MTRYGFHVRLARLGAPGDSPDGARARGGVEPPGSARDLQGSGRRQHRRLLLPGPDRPVAPGDDRQLDPARGAGRRTRTSSTSSRTSATSSTSTATGTPSRTSSTASSSRGTSATADTLLQNTGPVSSPTDPNLNVYYTYNGREDASARRPNQANCATIGADDLLEAPNNVGPKSYPGPATVRARTSRRPSTRSTRTRRSSPARAPTASTSTSE